MTDKIKNFPEMIDLKIHRETLLSQERVDHLCDLVWKNCTSSVLDLLENAKLPFDESRDYRLADPNYKITEYLRDLEKTKEIEALSYTEMVHFLYELDRRIRKIVGVSEINVIGNPIAQSPKGPFPKLSDVAIIQNDKRLVEAGLTQDNADLYCQEIYAYLIKEHAEILYAFCEFRRRLLRYGEATDLFRNVAKKGYAEHSEIPFHFIFNELKRRLLFEET